MSLMLTRCDPEQDYDASLSARETTDKFIMVIELSGVQFGLKLYA